MFIVLEDDRMKSITASDNSVEVTSLTTRQWVLLASLAFLLLLPMLTLPLGPDNGLFFVAGEKIAHQGAVHYRDIVDVKPPLIYHLNALAITLFGDAPLSIRILDLILQSLTCLFLVKLIRRASGNDLWATTALLLYPLLYLSHNYTDTVQVESFLGLFIFPAISLFLFHRKPLGFLAIGLLCGIVAFFKFTFGICLAGFLIGDLLLYSDRWKARLKNYGAMGMGFGAVVGLFLLYLTLFNAWQGFMNMQQFLSGYIGLQYASEWDFLRETLSMLPKFLVDEYTLTVLIGTVIGIGIGFSVEGFRKGEKKERTSAELDSGRLLLRISTILFLLLLFTIVLEAKWVHYRLSRLFPFGALLGSLGLLQILKGLRRELKDGFRWIGIGLALILLLGFSPVTRYVFHLRPAILLLTKGPTAFDAYYAHNRADDDWTREDLREIGNFVSSNMKPDERLFISSGVAGLLYLESNYVPDFHIFHSGFLIAPFSPATWLDSTVVHLQKTRPRFIVVQTNDRIPIVTGTDETSEELFNRVPEIANLLRKEYSVAMERPSFKVFELSALEDEIIAQP